MMNETAALSDDLKELEKVLPYGVRVPIPDQPSINVSPLTVRQIAKIGKALRKIMANASGDVNIEDLLTEYPDEVITIVSVAVNKSEDWFEALRVDTALQLAVAVFEVNASFFKNEVGPVVAKMASIMGSIGAASGPGNSSSSGTTDTKAPKTTPLAPSKRT